MKGFILRVWSIVYCVLVLFVVEQLLFLPFTGKDYRERG